MEDVDVPFDWRARTPGPPLSRFVEQIWYSRGRVGYRRERIAPTGSTVVVIVLGDPITETADDGRGTPLRSATGFVIGPHSGPVVNEPSGETHAYGVVTTPIGCQAALGIAPAAIRGRVLEALDAWPVAAEVRAALAEVDDPEAGLDLIERALGRDLRPDVPGLARVEAAVAALEAEPGRPIRDLAAELGVSHGHLDREFRRVVGLGPVALARLLRLRRLLADLDVARGAPWAELAAELGWFDQAHLTRDFRRHTGVSPARYLAAQRAVPQVVDAPAPAGFVPEM